jgi:hypothetical protein
MTGIKNTDLDFCKLGWVFFKLAAARPPTGEIAPGEEIAIGSSR